jgi:hypothetical protein
MIKIDNIAQQKHIVITPLLWFFTIIETMDNGQVLTPRGHVSFLTPGEQGDAFLPPPGSVSLAHMAQKRRCSSLTNQDFLLSIHEIFLDEAINITI